MVEEGEKEGRAAVHSTSRTVDRLCPIPNCAAAAAGERSGGVREGKEEKGEGVTVDVTQESLSLSPFPRFSNPLLSSNPTPLPPSLPRWFSPSALDQEELGPGLVNKTISR